MTYSDWRAELSEGVKTRLVVKGLKAIKNVIKAGGKKITRDVGSIGAPKASGRVIRRNPDKSGVSGKSLERRVQDRNRKQNPNMVSSPSSDAKQLISKKEKGEYVPITKEMSQKIKDILKNFRKEEVMAAPTNSTGSAVPGTGDDSSTVVVKKKKRYIYGGTGSRKMWMNNK